jgi:hypothetical protein
MCSVSNIGDQYNQRYQNQFGSGLGGLSAISRLEFDSLRIEVQQLKELLLKAKELDRKEGNPDCEMEAKVAILRKVAEAVGVNLDDVFGPKKK